MELTQAQKDALLAEVLGDVGKLHDLVGQLATEFTSARAGMLATIQDAVNAIQPHATKVFAAEAEFAAMRAADQHKAVLRGLIEDAVTKPIGEATHALKMQAALAADASNHLQRQAGDTLWRFWLPIGGLAAAFVLVIGLGAAAFGMWINPQNFLGPTAQSDLHAGTQLREAWPHLDEATQRRVMAAMSVEPAK